MKNDHFEQPDLFGDTVPVEEGVSLLSDQVVSASRRLLDPGLNADWQQQLREIDPGTTRPTSELSNAEQIENARKAEERHKKLVIKQRLE